MKEKFKIFIKNYSVAIFSCAMMALLLGVWFTFANPTKTIIGDNVSILGGLQLTSGSGTKPTCNASTRGMMWVEKSDSGIEDIIMACNKKADNSYEWIPFVGGTYGKIASNPGKSCYDILIMNNYGDLGIDGLYWVQPLGENPVEIYCDMTRNGGGWGLVARVTWSSCQAHITRSVVGSTPRPTDTSTTKMADTWIQNYKNASPYGGTTAYWMEAQGPPSKNVFISSAATVNLADSAYVGDPARTNVSLTFEGGFSQRTPNTGTRGFGDHHTSGGVYFAWGRHPEQGYNCGFCTDGIFCHPNYDTFTNGYLWVK